MLSCVVKSVSPVIAVFKFIGINAWVMFPLQWLHGMKRRLELGEEESINTPPAAKSRLEEDVEPAAKSRLEVDVEPKLPHGKTYVLHSYQISSMNKQIAYNENAIVSICWWIRAH